MPILEFSRETDFQKGRTKEKMKRIVNDDT